MTPRPNLAGLTPDGIARALDGLPARRFVPRQIFRWLHGRRVRSFAAMTDIGLALRTRLGEGFDICFPEVEARRPSGDGTTRYVYRLADGTGTESVLIPGETGHATLCLSSQVGCALACGFCVSGLIGVKRNLATAEIVGQAHAMLADIPGLVRTNVVFMGMGEALLNFDAVVAACTILAHPDGPAISLRRMTVSTAGHVPAIERFGALASRPRLAVSLNATNDETRDRIMPINRTWPLAALLAALGRFPLRPAERITFEYVLLAGVNDTLADARRIPGLLSGIPAKVNLIPYNPSSDLPFASPTPENVELFRQTLAARMTVTVRRRRGSEVGAACGQLALEREEAQPA